MGASSSGFFEGTRTTNVLWKHRHCAFLILFDHLLKGDDACMGDRLVGQPNSSVYQKPAYQEYEVRHTQTTTSGRKTESRTVIQKSQQHGVRVTHQSNPPPPTPALQALESSSSPKPGSDQVIHTGDDIQGLYRSLDQLEGDRSGSGTPVREDEYTIKSAAFYPHKDGKSAHVHMRRVEAKKTGDDQMLTYNHTQKDITVRPRPGRKQLDYGDYSSRPDAFDVDPNPRNSAIGGGFGDPSQEYESLRRRETAKKKGDDLLKKKPQYIGKTPQGEPVTDAQVGKVL